MSIAAGKMFGARKALVSQRVLTQGASKLGRSAESLPTIQTLSTTSQPLFKSAAAILKEREAKHAALGKFWLEEPAKVMKSVREQQHAERDEMMERLAKLNAADAFISRYLDSTHRSQHTAAEVPTTEKECVAQFISNGPTESAHLAKSGDTMVKTIIRFSGPSFESAWKIGCNKGCKVACQEFVALFEREKEVEVEVDVDAPKKKVDVKVNV